MRNNYKTKQKDKIMDIVNKSNKIFKIKDIYESVNEEIGLTTIYRLVDKLVDENKLVKFISKDNITYYQYLESCNNDNHFYLRCDKCGRIIHVDCDCINELSNHIFNSHEFTPNKEKIIINGICKNCCKEG